MLHPCLRNYNSTVAQPVAACKKPKHGVSHTASGRRWSGKPRSGDILAFTLQAGASAREADAEPMDEDAKQAASAKVVNSL